MLGHLNVRENQSFSWFMIIVLVGLSYFNELLFATFLSASALNIYGTVVEHRRLINFKTDRLVTGELA